MKQTSLFESIYDSYQKYENDGDPLLYHTADYSNGSSGGGFFEEKNGHYLGMVSYGSTVGGRKSTFFGVGQLYRIDAICRQSKTLSRMEKCQKLLYAGPDKK